VSFYGFKNVSQLGTALVSDQIEASIYSWLEWALLGIGSFSSVSLSTQTAHGSKYGAKLRPVLDPRYPADAGYTYIFEGVRSDWIWESGIEYSSQPIQISGVYVSGTYVPSTSSGIYQHQILYPEGRVVFTNALPTGADIQVEHSYRQVHVRRADESWFQSLMFRSFRADEDFQSPPGSGGAWDILSQNRVQLPAVVIETVDSVNMRPLEIGSGARIHRQPVLFHILSETPWERRRLHDILIEQYDKRIPSFDRNGITFPLDYQGGLMVGAKTYPQLVEANPWRQIRIVDVQSTQQEEFGKKLYWSTVRFVTEVDAP